MEVMQRKLRYSDTQIFTLYHLCYYFSKAEDYDRDRQLVLDFKNGEEPAVRHFILKALAFFSRGEMNDELIVLRPLRSMETKYDSSTYTALDRLGESLAAVFHSSYFPSVIAKSKPTRQVKTLSPAMRKEELRDVYQLDLDYFNFNYRPLLIIDDVVTTGATVCAIIAVILKAYPQAKINVFSLAWTPTPNQQLLLRQQSENIYSLNEPEVPYGSKSVTPIDEDFENGETNVSLFS